MSQLTDAASHGGSGTPQSGRGRKRALLIVFAVLAVLALILTGGAFAYGKSFDGKALPGTQVLGNDVSGQSAEEIADTVQKRADDVTVTVDADGKEHETSLADLGVSVNAEATGTAALERDGSFAEAVTATWSGERNVQPVVEVDDEQVTSFAKGLIPEDRTAPVDAQVVRDDESGSWNVKEAQEGHGVDAAVLVDAVSAEAASLEDFTVEQPVEKTAPAITTDDAKATLDELRSMLEQPMSITGPDDSVHEVSSDLRSSWIAVEPTKDGDALKITVDEDAVNGWVGERAAEDAVEKKDGIEQVDKKGKTVNVVAEKQDGREITNTDAVSSELVEAITGAGALETAFESEKVKADVEKAKAPEDDKNKKDKEKDKDDKKSDKSDKEEQAESSGEKWIDVNLTDKTVTAYEGDEPVWGPRSMVDGKEGNETITGSYEIYLRYDKQDMTNEYYYEKDHPKYYYTEDVPWVQYFHNGFAFHGAPWRSDFGYSGSHGCINLPVNDAKWLYDWADIGTRVESHT